MNDYTYNFAQHIISNLKVMKDSNIQYLQSLCNSNDYGEARIVLGMIQGINDAIRSIEDDVMYYEPEKYEGDDV